MSRIYGEPVHVTARPDGRPIRFVWRSRLYTVHAILEHWVINREWWRDPADSGDPENPAVEPGQPELVFWRVEAAPGQGTTPEVCELRQDVATRAWTARLSLMIVNMEPSWQAPFAALPAPPRPYCMDGAAMQLQQHGCPIHAV